MKNFRALLDRINDIESTIARIRLEAKPGHELAYRLTLQSLEDRRNMLREDLTAEEVKRVRVRQVH